PAPCTRLRAKVKFAHRLGVQRTRRKEPERGSVVGDVSPEPSIGIDLGTTNSAVATSRDGALRLIERATGQRLLPSLVGFTDDGKRVVGEEARLLAESIPENVAWATKRFIGRRWTPELAAEARSHFPFTLVAGPHEDVRVKIGGQTLPVAQVAGMVL